MNDTSDIVSNTTLVEYSTIDSNNCTIALSSGIGIFACLLLYYLHLSFTFIGKPVDKIYYYLSCCVCIFPLIMYGLQLLNMHILYNGIYNNYLINMFDIEWLITTPVLIIKLGQLASLSLYEYIIILLLNESLFILGYVFSIVQNKVIATICFGIAANMYLGILGMLVYKYYKLRGQYDILTKATTKFLICSTAGLWSLYPIIAILYKFNKLSIDKSVIAYVVLDCFSKGVFTCILIGSREMTVKRNSIVRYITHRALRVLPEVEESIRTDSVDNFCRSVDIDGSREYVGGSKENTRE